MAVDENKYRRLKDAGFSHAAALALADAAQDELGLEGAVTPAALEAALVAERASHSATYARNEAALFAPGRKWAFLGDSLTYGNNADPLYGFVDVAIRVVGSSRVREVQDGSINAGVAGNTSEGMLNRFDADVAALNPQGLHIQPGVNDAMQAVPLATFAANIEAIAAKAKALGIPVTIGTATPLGASNGGTTQRNLIGAYNTWLRLWAPSVGLIVADTYAAVVDPATGDLRADYDTDGTHPDNAGHAAIGMAVAAAIEATMSMQTSWPVSAKQSISLVGNPLMAGAGPLPSNWDDATWFGASGTAPTFSTVADTSGALTAGQWLQAEWNTAAASSRTVAASLSGDLSAGGRFMVLGKIQVDDVAGWQTAITAGTAYIRMHLTDNNTGTNIKAVLEAVDVTNPGPFAAGVTLPPGHASVSLAWRIAAPSGVQARIRLGQADVYNLTALGITD